MKTEEINLDMDELKRFKEQNAKERLEFIDWWANYIKSHKDEEWSKGQNKFIDAQILMSRRFYKNLSQTEEGRKKIELLRKK